MVVGGSSCSWWLVVVVGGGGGWPAGGLAGGWMDTFYRKIRTRMCIHIHINMHDLFISVHLLMA